MEEQQKKDDEEARDVSMAQALERRHGKPQENGKGLEEIMKVLDEKPAYQQPPKLTHVDEIPTKLLDEMEAELGPFLCRVHERDYYNLEHGGPYGLMTVPEHRNGELYFVTTLSSSIKKSTWHSILRKKNPYLMETDLADVEEVVGSETLQNLFPELSTLVSFVGEIITPNYGGDNTQMKRKNLAHPYMIAMGVETDLRPYVTAAIKRAIDEKKIAPPKEVKPNEVHGWILMNVPPIECFAEVAKEYGLKNLRPVLEAVRTSVVRYIK